MPDIIETAGAASTSAASTESAIPSDAQRVAAATALLGQPEVAETIPSKAPPPPAPVVPPAPAPESMASLIRAQREARQAREQESRRATTLEQELKTAREELARAKSDRQAFEDDPVGYAKDRKWTPEQQLLYGQSLLYDIVPDKADPNFRVKMFEDKQRRESAARDRAAKEEQAQAAAAAERQQIQDFVAVLDTATQAFTAGSYPESEDWFGSDRASYMQSLIATAKNMAEVATREHRVADLSPGALAAALEAETSRRMTEREQRKQKRMPPAPPVVAPAARALAAASGMQSVETASTKNMNGAGTPPPPPANDKERIQRAIEAGFARR